MQRLVRIAGFVAVMALAALAAAVRPANQRRIAPPF